MAIIAFAASIIPSFAPGAALSGTESRNGTSQQNSSAHPPKRSLDQPVDPARAVRWETVALEGVSDEIRAVAVTQSAELAVGDSRGVLIGSAPDALRRHWLRGAVRHIQFFSVGQSDTPDLLVATEQGLYRAGFEAAGRPIAPAPGGRAAAVTQLATAGRVSAIATDDGVFVSLDGQAWQRLGGLVPTGRASVVALRERGEGVECWAVIRGQLWRVAFQATARANPQSALEPEQTSSRSPGIHPRVPGQTVLRQTSATLVELPFGPDKREPVGLALDIDSAEIVVVYDSAIVVSRADESATSGFGWDVLRPGLPPGASIVELAEAIGWCWLATDRGLFRARNLRGPWRLSTGPLSSRPIGDLAAGKRKLGPAEMAPSLYVATDRGLMAATPGPKRDARRLLRRDSRDPGIRQVHRAALDYLELDPSRVREIHRGLDLRGWLPSVGFSAGRDTDRSRSTDFDEAYLSGGLRELRDSDRGRSTELELRLSLSWDLGDIAYHPERIDILREAREVIELRDEVLDEVTQLYFERQRVLAKIQSLQDEREALPLEIRAEQLAAGIDAWTGGWFSDRVRTSHLITPSTSSDLAPRDRARRRMTRDSGHSPSPVPNPSEKNLSD